MPDPRVKFIPIGCQDCIECRTQKARGWQIRLLEDIKTNRNGKFITLTFSNESIADLAKKVQLQHIKTIKKQSPYLPTSQIKRITGYDLDNAIATYAVRKFLELHRKHHKTSLRHWLVTELGHNGTENIHLHGIVWSDLPMETIAKYWKHGFVWKGKPKNGRLINYVNDSTVNYTVKYIYKQDLNHKCFKAKILTSPGIGRNYTNTLDAQKNRYGKWTNGTTNESYRTRTGHKMSLPIYWRNKLYTDQEREKLWLERLDKQERWICGEKVSIKNGETAYYSLLKWHQERNLRLGFGNGQRTWDRKKYEEQRRELLIQQRIACANKTQTQHQDTTASLWGPVEMFQP